MERTPDSDMLVTFTAMIGALAAWVFGWPAVVFMVAIFAYYFWKASSAE